MLEMVGLSSLPPVVRWMLTLLTCLGTTDEELVHAALNNQELHSHLKKSETSLSLCSCEELGVGCRYFVKLTGWPWTSGCQFKFDEGSIVSQISGFLNFEAFTSFLPQLYAEQKHGEGGQWWGGGPQRSQFNPLWNVELDGLSF